MSLLTLRGLTIRFGQQRVVDDMSLDLEPGHMLALVGESGSGKSLTAMSLLDLLPESAIWEAETLTLGGENLLGLNENRKRSLRGGRIGTIFQEPLTALNPLHTVEKQISESLFVHQGMSRQKARERCLELLGQVELPTTDEMLARYPHQLSGGQRQRVMIAMALANDPALLIADEPTTALDVTVQAQILELLRDLVRANNSSMMLITHDLGVVARYADRINVMYAGRIVERGTAEEIFHHPKHPYTLGLMESMPRLDQAPGSRLTPIPGQPPDLSDPPPGCPFHPRCRFAEARCRSERPPLEQITDNHWKACWVDTDAKR